MHSADIIAAIHKANTTATKIAKAEGVNRCHVSAVIHGRVTSHPVAYAIAAVTGFTTEQMWPGKYLEPAVYREVRKNKSRGRIAGC